MGCLFFRHAWQGCVCTKCGKEHHQWDGCVCSRCGKERHNWIIITREIYETIGGTETCCWDVSQPCTGPGCGTPCDSYTAPETRGTGRYEKIRQCTRCLLEYPADEEEKQGN